MASTHRRTWQQAEGRAAFFFGVRRQVSSGSSGRDDLTASDSTHPTLFIESKLRDRHAARTLHDSAKKRAMKERKTHVLVLFDKNRPGCLLCVHSTDFMAVTAEFVAALTADERSVFEGLVRMAFARGNGGETV
jgi:hypothetical protein